MNAFSFKLFSLNVYAIPVSSNRIKKPIGPPDVVKPNANHPHLLPTWVAENAIGLSQAISSSRLKAIRAV
jgi:hypothetical protein